MSATEDWLRYIESKMLKKEYNISGYTQSEDTKEDTEEQN